MTAAGQTNPPLNVSLTPSAGSADTEVTSFVYLSGTAPPVGQLDLEIGYPEKFLAFVKAEVRVPEGTIDASVAKDPQGAAVLHVGITGKPGQGMPEGRIAALHFRILADAPPDKDIVLTNRATGMTPGDHPKPIEPIVTEEGRVTVRTLTVYGCFFYMH